MGLHETCQHHEMSRNLEANQLSGNLSSWLLSSNNFTGELPVTLAKLSQLKDLWIEGNGFSGPIPSGISNLENLTDLRISDLRGSVPSTFPLLEKLTKLQILVMRNCNIIGDLPEYLAKMTSLRDNLDLSFNKLTGQIPVTYAALSKVTNIYLTGNLLNGSVPSWIEDVKSM
ncbi:hypothetical protein VNO80_27077 [Phaseolus coccineus]|uniref:Uncharacterized protein n=1 Tax=Phaseolus coccineus TaxID=3886 RepID=A0AAN9QH92_PHACN